MVPPVSTLQDRVAERLDALGLKPQSASIAAGLNRDAVRNILRGASLTARYDTLAALARVLQCSVAYLTGDENAPPSAGAKQGGSAQISGARLPVRYEVGAGFWVQTDSASDVFLGEGFVLPDPAYAGFDQWLERVRGDSMDREYPDGVFIHVVDAAAIGYAPRHEDHVVLTLYRNGRGLVERSVKEVVMSPTGIEFWPRSHNPRWATPIIPAQLAQDTDGDIELEVAGLVLGSYRPRR